VTLAPSRLALTTTPSIALSAAELTCPVSAAGACAFAGRAARMAAVVPATKVSKMLRDGIGVSSISVAHGDAPLHASFV
jgi:hypothetical protein